MFELLTCRQPLAEINNINVHVVHGGRPTLKTEVRAVTVLMFVLFNNDYRNTIHVCKLSVDKVFLFLYLYTIWTMNS